MKWPLVPVQWPQCPKYDNCSRVPVLSHHTVSFNLRIELLSSIQDSIAIVVVFSWESWVFVLFACYKLLFQQFSIYFGFSRIRVLLLLDSSLFLLLEYLPPAATCLSGLLSFSCGPRVPWFAACVGNMLSLFGFWLWTAIHPLTQTPTHPSTHSSIRPLTHYPSIKELLSTYCVPGIISCDCTLQRPCCTWQAVFPSSAYN